MSERRSQRKQARSYLKIPIDEIIRQSLGNVSLEENLCILGVPEIWAGAETEGYYSINPSVISLARYHQFP